jgi:hypothetical protein
MPLGRLPFRILPDFALSLLSRFRGKKTLASSVLSRFLSGFSG